MPAMATILTQIVLFGVCASKETGTITKQDILCTRGVGVDDKLRGLSAPLFCF